MREDLAHEKDRTAQLEEDFSSADAKQRELSAALQDVRAELASARNQISDLKQRLNPTLRDKNAFAEILNIFEWQNGALLYLETIFGGKRWHWTDIEAIVNFDTLWRERFFDDQKVQEAFAALQRSCSDLREWFAGEGSPDPGSLPDSDGEYWYSIASGDERPGGWPDFDKARGRGLKLVADFIDKRVFDLDRGGCRLGGGAGHRT